MMVRILKAIVLGLGAIFIVAGIVAAVLQPEATDESVPRIGIHIPPEWPKRDQDIANGTFQLLSSTCPDVARYWDQMEEQKVELLPAYVAENYGLAKSHGWGMMVRFSATVKPDAKLPRKWRDASGQTLAWDFGASGDKLGIHIIKDQAAWFCGQTHGDIVIATRAAAAAGTEAPWYEGGTLDRATFARWKTAEDRDRFATMAGWVMEFFGNERKKIANEGELRLWVEPAVVCVNKVAELASRDYKGAAAEAAKVCMTKMNFPHD